MNTGAIFKEFDKWWFWDEYGDVKYGPYESEKLAFLTFNDVKYVWYNAKKNEIRQFSSCGHLLLKAYVLCDEIKHVIYLGKV